MKLSNQKRLWFLLLGENHAGKTSWLNQAGLTSLQIISSDEQTHRINVTEQAVLLDIPSNYLTKNNHSLLEALAKNLRPHRSRKSLIDGVIVFFDLVRFLEQTREEQCHSIQMLQESIAYFTEKKSKQLVTYFIFSHMDHLLGFNEFFSDLTEPLRQQYWGIDLSNENFNECYSQFLGRLNQQVIYKLHRERNLQKRVLIKEFPVQMETLKQALQSLITQWQTTFAIKNSATKNCIGGIYFCSTKQQGTPIDRLAKSIHQNLNIESPPVANIFPQQKSYFTKQLIPHLLSITQQKSTPSRVKGRVKKLFTHSSYGTAAVFTIIGAVYLTHYFHTQMNQLQTAEYAIHTFQFLNQQNRGHGNSTQTLAALNALAKAKDLLDLTNKSHLKADAKQAYTLALQAQFLPFAADYLSQQMADNIDSPSSDLYALLKAYLMLGNVARKQSGFVETVLAHYWKNDPELSESTVKALKRHLHDALIYQTAAVPLTAALVEQTRATLNTLPYALLVYLNLKNQFEDSGLHIFSVNNSEFAIPRIYTKEKFIEIYDHVIPQMSENAMNGDWVIGKYAADKNMPSKMQLTESLRSFYLTDYANWWNLSLLKTELVSFKNIEHAENMLTQLSDKNSPLIKMLLAIENNTSPLPDNSTTANNFNQAIADKFTAVNTLFDSAQKPTHVLTQAQANLNKLRDYLKQITGANNTDAAAFKLAKKHVLAINNPENKEVDPFDQLDTLGKSMPAPLQKWMHSIVVNTWQFILERAQRHINQQWITQVLPEYAKHIENRYPLTPTGTEEISLEHFQRFFAPKGILNNFFINYLQPFIDTSQPQWQNKRFNDVALNIQPDVLQQLERANIIRQMFFPKDSPTIYVEFNLQPILFEPSIRKMALTINGQLLEDSQGDTTTSQFNWPGVPKTPLVQLEFNTIDGQFAAITTDGEWGWFRLLAHSNLEMTDNNARKYHLIFDLNGNAAKYQLIAHEEINPFIPHIIDHFRAPSVLIASTLLRDNKTLKNSRATS